MALYIYWTLRIGLMNRARNGIQTAHQQVVEYHNCTEWRKLCADSSPLTRGRRMLTSQWGMWEAGLATQPLWGPFCALPLRQFQKKLPYTQAVTHTNTKAVQLFVCALNGWEKYNFFVISCLQSVMQCKLLWYMHIYVLLKTIIYTVYLRFLDWINYIFCDVHTYTNTKSMHIYWMPRMCQQAQHTHAISDIYIHIDFEKVFSLCRKSLKI